MHFYDETQKILYNYLCETKDVFKELLLQKYGYGDVNIIAGLDFGFPHDVIRIAGGFATGVYVQWECKEPFVPVDTCVNDCAVTFFEVDRDIGFVFDKDYIDEFQKRMTDTIYKLNFHRGNHFILYVRSIYTGKKYLVFHSSANEFKDNYNGLYPTEKNYIYNCTKVYEHSNRYIRYVDGKAAELFWHISEQLPIFNEVRHEFIASVLLNHNANIINAFTSHHYCMPNSNSVLMGGHVTKIGMTLPLLTVPGQNIFLLQYNSVKDNDMCLPYEGEFLTPHGLGKCDTISPSIYTDYQAKKLTLDNVTYKIQWGESLRAHDGLALRTFDREKVFSYLDGVYNYTIEDEVSQIASINKNGLTIWDKTEE